MSNKEKKWKRLCPKCGNEIFYTRKYESERAKKRNTNCISCVMGSEEMRESISKSLKGIKRSEETRKRISKSKKGIKRSDEHRKNLSKSLKGRVPWNKGKTNIYSEETLKKMRLSRIKEIENKYGQIFPNYNSKAISIIRAKAKELKMADLMDAENGGEYHIKELGYFVDGYSPNKNIVIEYYESFHKNQVERDERRKQEIIEHLGCKFIEIRE